MYRLSATADDGVRVWIDGQQAIDAWYPQASTTKDGVIELEAGEHEIKVEYFQQVGGYSLWLQLAPMSPPAKKAMLALGGGVPQLDSHIIVLRQEITEHPADPLLKTLHARAMARRGRFDKAAAELQEVTRLDPTNAQQAYLRAALLAYLGNQSEYAKVCRAMFERFSATHDEIVREALIKACSLGDKLPVDLAEFQTLIDRSNSDPPMPFTSGPANYQAARYDLAAHQLTGGLPAAHSQPTTLATSRLFLAMCLQKLARNDEALAQFNAARPLVSEAIPIADVEDLDAVGLEEWLTCQIAWRRARESFQRP
jgi:tetratricopeptide (TPR) repeat protein